MPLVSSPSLASPAGRTYPIRAGTRLALMRLDAAPRQEELLALCTERELAKLSSKALEKRRLEWLTARALTKHVVLTHFTASAEETSEVPHAQAALGFVDSRALRALPSSRYRRLEVLAGRGETPRLYRDEEEIRSLRVSITHAAGWAGVAVSSTGPVGVDLEQVCNRPRTFYEDYFTAGEIAWVAQQSPGDRPALFTLLWTLKESCVKTGAVSARSVWALDTLELVVDTSSGHAATHCSCTAAGHLQPLELRVRPADAACVPRAAFARCANVLVSLVVLESRST